MGKISYIALTLLIIAFSSPVHAQQEEVDSLLQVLKSHKKQDEAKVNLLNKIVAAYFDSCDGTEGDSLKVESGLEYGRKSFYLAEKLNYHKGMALANHRIGIMRRFRSS